MIDFFYEKKSTVFWFNWKKIMKYDNMKWIAIADFSDFDLKWSILLIFLMIKTDEWIKSINDKKKINERSVFIQYNR